MVKKYCNSILLSAILVSIIIYSGLLQIKRNDTVKGLLNNSEIQILEGKLISSPVKTSNGKYYSTILKTKSAITIQNQYSSIYGNIKIFIPSEMVEAFYPGKLYSSSRKSGAYLWEKGGNYIVEGFLTNNGFYITKCFYGAFNINVIGRINYVRALARLQFKRMMYVWRDAGGLFLALLSGSKEYAEEDTISNFKKAGLSHILALSGMHLSLISGLSVFIGKKIKKKKFEYLLRIIFLIFFIWFAGFTPSLLRAFLCSLMLILASMSGSNKPDMLIILAFSFLLQIMISPNDYNNPGFILSYLSLAGILLIQNLFEKLFIKFLPVYISNPLSASCSAQLFTMPVSLKLFGSIAPIGIIASCFISPMITFFIYAGIILFAVCLVFPVLDEASGIFMNFLYTIIKYSVALFSKCPLFQINKGI